MSAAFSTMYCPCTPSPSKASPPIPPSASLINPAPGLIRVKRKLAEAELGVEISLDELDLESDEDEVDKIFK